MKCVRDTSNIRPLDLTSQKHAETLLWQCYFIVEGKISPRLIQIVFVHKNKEKKKSRSIMKSIFNTFPKNKNPIVNCNVARHLIYLLGMHDIYRTDKLSTNMSENDVIFIAPINKLNPISRSDKVWLLEIIQINQSIRFIWDSSAFREQVTAALNCSDSQLVSHSLHHHLWTCLRRSGSFSRWQRRTMPLLFAMHVQQGFREKENRRQVLTQQILYLTWKVIIAAKLY